MFKIILSVLLIISVFMFPAICEYISPIEVAHAENSITINVQNAIRKVECVDDCKVALNGKYAFVAIKTKGITTSEQCAGCIDKVKEAVKKVCPDVENVYVTTKVKIYKMLEDYSSKSGEIDIEDLFEVFFGFFGRQNPPMCPFREHKILPHTNER
ncbi:MAG: YhcN/YlaJ family sporulation lipoprotein [Clostridia bacterium]|nr:YhcN/YlaJ family sporulation lipoprotein [Clostridia bacterium]